MKSFPQHNNNNNNFNFDKQNCTCDRYEREFQALIPFKVSEHRTLLKCSLCDGLLGEWIDKIDPQLLKPNKEDLDKFQESNK